MSLLQNLMDFFMSVLSARMSAGSTGTQAAKDSAKQDTRRKFPLQWRITARNPLFQAALAQGQYFLHTAI